MEERGAEAGGIPRSTAGGSVCWLVSSGPWPCKPGDVASRVQRRDWCSHAVAKVAKVAKTTVQRNGGI